MIQRSFNVRAIWDANAGVWITESDIMGLHVEAQTLPELQDHIREYAADLIVANHLTAADMAKIPLRDLIPAIVITADLAARPAD